MKEHRGFSGKKKEKKSLVVFLLAVHVDNYFRRTYGVSLNSTANPTFGLPNVEQH